ncbi:CDP-diacylglycerol--serine O-phosphatidyltransferase [Aneurinibacillus sp. Ricciae_BoGa-3]|uniref:CDP-diacylglycerol--serine O-phosphatidyltransferase n=1 Tax=Aneurinibacillus sp. Ricciae_BoGa-3 TaxID=3022697 RepID=UPI00233FA553|nr:CDP-diacylglycerol--serine O-phosphatidyltransferase [Aneurinibacillus sp. Ricciae_BoGa-3]WCK56735.1 CDP-diacylglycerol--serine O-phosphatidyltransferase [Aneurinibacillus sp. Ricciae_BoGa-3]
MMGSLLRSIPNAFTLGNLVCGIFSITFAMNGFYKIAAALIMLAAVCDVFDGKLARMLKVDSPMGVELDSLADIVSFGVAPAILSHSMLHHSPLLTIAFIAFPIAGAWRLGRFNVSPTKGYYTGVPITLAGLITAVLAFFSFASPWLMIILAILMVSPLRIPKL